MSHHLYHTQGLILGAKNYGEANILYQILSPDLGLVGALAQGARYQKSKLRPHLRELDLVRVTLVRGRELWRLTAAESTGLLIPPLAQVEKRAVWARVAKLLLRLVRGEERQAGIYHDLVAGLQALACAPAEQVADYEQLIVLRLLAQLGYVAENQANRAWLASDLWQESWTLPAETGAELVNLINKGLEHSML